MTSERCYVSDPLTELFHELLGNGVDSSDGLHQIFLPVLNLHCSLWLQNTRSGKKKTAAGGGVYEVFPSKRQLDDTAGGGKAARKSDGSPLLCSWLSG